MGNLRGFRIRHKLVKVFNWSVRRRTKFTGYKRLNSTSCTAKAMSKLCDLGRCLKRGAKELCFPKSDTGYVGVGEEEPVGTVPKGHLAVYVGEKEDDAHRVLVPVIFFNHPLFGDLLREAEKVYGFNHSGGIQIPCPISDFENIQTKIIGGGSGSWSRRRSSRVTYW